MEENRITSTYDAEITCPVCDRIFRTKKTRQKHMRITKRDPDFCPYYNGINPIFYTAYICPNCGYGALEKHFKTVTVHGKASILKTITPKWVKKDFSGIRDLDTAINVHKLVLLCYTVMDYPSSEIGKLCLKLAWFYRYMDDPKEEEFLKHALKMLNKSYTDEPLEEDPKNESNILFLLGEISRLLGEYSKSVEWFGMALKSPGMAGNKQLEKLTRDQWAEAKTEYSKAKKEANE